MLSNYLKITLRNLWRFKFYTLINVLGLGVGIAAVVWAYQNYRFAFSFDDFHADRAHIFRTMVYREGNEDIRGVCPAPAAVLAADEFPGITHAIRMDSRGLTLKAENSEAIDQQVHFTDEGFFDVFNFPVIRGSNDLSDRSAVLITEQIAEKLYGKSDPIGKSIVFYAGDSCQLALKVTGVLKKLPMNTMMWCQMITHWDNLRNFDCKPVADDYWGYLADGVFFKLNTPEDAPGLESYLNKFIEVQNTTRPDWKITRFAVESLPVASQRSEMSSNGFMERPEDSAAYGPFVLAILILISACLNFANTTVARSNSRLREMGVRKVMGGTRGQLMYQMLSECSVVVFIAILLSIGLNKLWLPAYNKMWTYLDLQANYMQDHALQIFLLSTLIGTTVLAGAYPAFYISSFNPTSIFRGSVKFGGTNLFSRLLLGLQVVIALITVIAGVSFARNADFQKKYDFGYARDHILVANVPDKNTFSAYQNVMKQNPNVVATCGTRQHLGYNMPTVVIESEGQKLETRYMRVGEGYLDMMELKTATGRAFDPKLESDYTNAMMITEKLSAQLGWIPENAVGKQIRFDTTVFSVVGVLKDFHATELFNPVEPVAVTLARPDQYHSLIVRAEPANLKAVMDDMRTTWNTLNPLKPFFGIYQNELIAEGIEVSNNIARIMLWFALISVILTATGLFALISLTLIKKMKELAVRRIVGASTGQLIALINKGYIWIFLIAAALGCYAGYALTKLLMDLIFKVHIDIGAEIMLVSCVVLIVIVGVTITLKIVTALRTNPAEVLKAE